MNLTIHHLGYLVKDLDRSRRIFEKLGYRTEGQPTDDQDRMVQILFLNKDGSRIELVAPHSRESRYYPLLTRYRNAVYHICYETESMETATEELLRSGFVCTELPAAAPALDGRRVSFFVHPHMGMVELVERSDRIE